MKTQFASQASELNSKLYSTFRKELSEFFPSERHFFENEIQYHPGFTMLDVGGAAGGLGFALKQRFGNRINYTCIDPDTKAIQAGKKLFLPKYPDLKLIAQSFPSKSLKPPYDLVTVIGWFAQVSKWKPFLRHLVRASRKYINIGINVRLDGPTIIDRDTSYMLYLDSGERIHEITHNLWEMLNYCSIPEIGAKKICFYGYTSPGKKSSAFRPLPRSEQVQGNLFIELQPKSVKTSKLAGGISNEALQAMTAQGANIQTYRPEFKIIINDERIDY